MELITLDDGVVRVDVDPGRGCDILQIRHLARGIDLLAETPWRARADAIRAGESAPTSADSTERWMEQYRGGWQTLCPNAGPPRMLDGTLVGFHGEASGVPWDAHGVTPTAANFTLSLGTVPVRIERELSVAGGAVRVVDVLTNTGGHAVDIDYVSHPAFGGAFLDGTCTVDVPGARFTADDGAGTADLRTIPAPGSRRALFGWLSGAQGRASITNEDLGLRALVEWDPRVLPHAWWWQELNGTSGAPWFGRARMMAIEPASTVTSGPGRARTLRLEAAQSRTVAIGLTVETSSFEEEQA